MDADLANLDLERIRALGETENARFVADRPRSMELLDRGRESMPRGVPMSWMDDLYAHAPIWVTEGQGAYFTDVDGHRYLDMYIADASGFCGHAPAAVIEAVSRRIERGNQFLLPNEDAITVAEHLADRYRMPKWQFTSSATQANTEVIRLARETTGRETVVVFDGKYHGELDATLVIVENGEVVPESRGLPGWVSGHTRIVSFNDVDGLREALAPGDVAVVLAEPAMTNAGLLLPRDGFHEALRAMAREAGTLLALDETHSLITDYGGLCGRWDLEPDFLTVGKSVAAGVPFGAYGMTDEIGALIAPPAQSRVVSGAFVDEVATGGTLFANALSMAAARAALTEVLTEEAFDHAATLGERMAVGLRAAIVREGLGWSVVQLGGHAFYFFTAEPPIDAAGSRAADDPDLRALIRVFMINRGVWESGWWLGPSVSVAHTEANVDRYVEVFGEFLTAATG